MPVFEIEFTLVDQVPGVRIVVGNVKGAVVIPNDVRPRLVCMAVSSIQNKSQRGKERGDCYSSVTT